MPIDWRRDVRPETVADLIARKKYARAIDLVQSRLETEPTPAVRLQLANLLVQAGRGPEAVPLLMGLADEFVAVGFLARAVAALKRVEKIEPGRSDVESRLRSLARERTLTAKHPFALTPVPAAPLPRRPAPAPEAQATPSAPTPAAPSVAPEIPREAAPSEGRVKGRIVGAWRRLFGRESQGEASIPKEEPSPAFPEPVAEVPAKEEPAKEEEAAAPPPIDFIETAPGPRSRLPEEDTRPKILLPGEHADAPSARRPRREPTPGEAFLSMPEDALLDRVEDLIEDLFLPDLGTPPAPPPPVSLVVGGLAGLMFDELRPDERLSVLRGLKLRTFEPGDVIVTEGEPRSGLYLLTVGGVKVYTRDSESRNHPLGRLEEGDFFGEIVSRSGLPRDATVVASAPGELLEFDQASLDHLAASHPQVWARMHAFARERALSQKASVATEEAGGTPPGETFEPKLRLRVASAFLHAGQREEALQILLDLTDELVRRGEVDKAVALLKKVERVRSGDMPPARGALPVRPEGPSRRRPIVTDDKLGLWIHGLSKPKARAPASPKEPRVWADRLSEPETLRAYAGLRDCRLFDELDEEQLLTLLQRLPLESCEPGDITLTEGEPSDSVLVLATGRLKVFVRQRSGRDAQVRELGEGEFLGDMGVLAGPTRATTTTTAAAPSMLLRMGRKPLDALCQTHPHTRTVLEEAVSARSTNPEELSLRDDPGGD